MPAQKVNAFQIAKALKEAQKIAIFGHVLPDSDCYGSVFGMKAALAKAGKEVFVYLDARIPYNLEFFKDFDDLKTYSHFQNADIALVFDASALDRVENLEILKSYKDNGAPVFVIDHHIPGGISDFADFLWQDSDKSSASEMAFDILKAAGFSIDKGAATFFLAGIEGDTGGFQHQNTTRESLEAAGYLISKGARYRLIADNLLNPQNGLNILKLYGLVLERLIYNKKYQTVTSYLTLEDAKKFGVEGDSYSGVANLLNVIDGAKAIIFISEREGGIIKVSLRTRDEGVDVQKLAGMLGGGGHVKASGFTVKGRIQTVGGRVKII